MIPHASTRELERKGKWANGKFGVLDNVLNTLIATVGMVPAAMPTNKNESRKLVYK